MSMVRVLIDVAVFTGRHDKCRTLIVGVGGFHCVVVSEKSDSHNSNRHWLYREG